MNKVKEVVAFIIGALFAISACLLMVYILSNGYGFAFMALIGGAGICFLGGMAGLSFYRERKLK